MGTPLKPAEAAERLFPATQPDGARAVEPLPPATNPSPSRSEFRRAFPRIPCRVLVDYVVDGKAYRDCIANISEGGAFIETCHVLRTGRPITLSFTLFQDQQPLRVTGEVVWSGATGAGVKLQPNATIGQFCSKQEEIADAPLESFEPPESQPESPAAESPRPAPHVTHRRAGSVLAVVLPSIALLAVAVTIIVARYDTRTEILAVGEKVDRSSLHLARIEAAVARRNDPARVAPPAAPPAAAAEPAHTAKDPSVAKPDSADPSQMAAVPAAGTPDSAPAQAATQETTYVVQSGDTLFRIGLKFNLSPKALIDFNQLANADAIYVGQRIRIPSTEIR